MKGCQTSSGGWRARLGTGGTQKPFYRSDPNGFLFLEGIRTPEQGLCGLLGYTTREGSDTSEIRDWTMEVRIQAGLSDLNLDIGRC